MTYEGGSPHRRLNQHWGSFHLLAGSGEREGSPLATAKSLSAPGLGRPHGRGLAASSAVAGRVDLRIRSHFHFKTFCALSFPTPMTAIAS